MLGVANLKTDSLHCNSMLWRRCWQTNQGRSWKCMEPKIPPQRHKWLYTLTPPKKKGCSGLHSCSHDLVITLSHPCSGKEKHLMTWGTNEETYLWAVLSRCFLSMCFKGFSLLSREKWIYRDQQFACQSVEYSVPACLLLEADQTNTLLSHFGRIPGWNPQPPFERVRFPVSLVIKSRFQFTPPPAIGEHGAKTSSNMDLSCKLGHTMVAWHQTSDRTMLLHSCVTEIPVLILIFFTSVSTLLHQTTCQHKFHSPTDQIRPTIPLNPRNYITSGKG